MRQIKKQSFGAAMYDSYFEKRTDTLNTTRFQLQTHRPIYKYIFKSVNY